MDSIAHKKNNIYGLAFLILAAVFCTYLRISFLILYPLIVLAVYFICEWKLNIFAIYLFVTITFFWLLSLRNGFFIKYNALSFYYFSCFFLLLFAEPLVNQEKPSYLRLLMNGLTIVISLNNVIGVFQYIAFPNDDSFVGLYGRFTVSQNGLSILNAILFFYYLVIFQYSLKTNYLILSLFFLICCVLGFYGAGQIVLIAALILTYLKFRNKSILRLILVSTFVIAIVVLFMKIISPATLEYNIAIIKKFTTPISADSPRKLIIFKNYLTGYTSDILSFLFGSGPGTFNSRSAFMIGSPTYFNIDLIKSDIQPYYFKHYSYALWNATNTGPYDGFMNQPFTSILSLLGEYGLIVTLSILIFVVKRFRRVSQITSARLKADNIQVEARMYKFCSIYAFLLILIDNYIEYPEIIGLLLILIKMSQQEIKKRLTLSHNS